MHSVVLREQTMGQKANAELELTSLAEKKLTCNGPDMPTRPQQEYQLCFYKKQSLTW
jgi:hypothetical protein